MRHPDGDALQEALRGYIEADLARRHDPAHSPDLAVFLALLSVYGQLIRIGDRGPWWHGFFSYLASGPPGPRLRQLLALSRAGVVRFLGAGTTVTADAAGRRVPRGERHRAGRVGQARALVEARLPEPTVEHTQDSLLRALHADGAASTPAGLLAVDPADGRILDRSGAPAPPSPRPRSAHRRALRRRLRTAPYQRARLPAERRQRPGAAHLPAGPPARRAVRRPARRPRRPHRTPHRGLPCR